MLNNKVLIENIRRLCNQHNIKITNLEKELGFGAGIISRWGNDADPSLSKIIQISDYFNVSIDEITGYKHQKSKDEFLEVLNQMTSSKKIIWHVIDKNTNKRVERPHKNLMLEPYDEDQYSEVCYFTEYKNGFIIIYCFYQYGKFLDPNELALYIQPPNQTDYIHQDYLYKDLKPLWIKILSNLEEVPIEIKAEEFKNSFVNEFISKDSGATTETIHIDKK